MTKRVAFKNFLRQTDSLE